MDHIIIRGVEVFAYHGVYAKEREEGQKFLIDADLECDTSKAANSDELEDSIDYGKVTQLISTFMIKNQVNLLETLANQLAVELLTTFTECRNVTVEIRKPNAPIPVTFQDVAIKVTRGWHTAYIATGSNMGDREGNIENAILNLGADTKFKIIKTSKYYETKPYGEENQDNFLNGMVKLKTCCTPYELLDRLKVEERRAGRVKTSKWGPRPLDLDIIYYDDIIIDDENLTIPHGDMVRRDFVLQPLKDISPFHINPHNRLNTCEMLDRLTDRYIIQ